VFLLSMLVAFCAAGAKSSDICVVAVYGAPSDTTSADRQRLRSQTAYFPPSAVVALNAFVHQPPLS
jgi:hypothetical protein